jgi:uncharacterized protein (TIGR03084 family)
MEQAQDFATECQVLLDAVAGLGPWAWDAPTQFKGWTLNDVFVHLHFWNEMADCAAFTPDVFQTRIAEVIEGAQAGGLRPVENRLVVLRGPALCAAWAELWRDMAPRWAGIDPKARVPWVGPDMSARSCITARQMETWAHGQEVFDHLGLVRSEGDRLRNIVVLGVNTFGWSFTVNGRLPPAQMPFLDLTAPSGARWTFGEEQADNRITGPALAFAQVVTQTRNIADTGLQAEGPVATEWMALAQCFAGAPETPPPPGTRFRKGG